MDLLGFKNKINKFPKVVKNEPLVKIMLHKRESKDKEGERCLICCIFLLKKTKVNIGIYVIMLIIRNITIVKISYFIIILAIISRVCPSLFIFIIYKENKFLLTYFNFNFTISI